jgi:sugar phosphate isomerase/epimerase
MKTPIALQLYTVRNDMAADFEGTLKKVKEMGYDGVEFAGIYGKTAAEVKAICKEIGLVPISAHLPLVDMIANPDIMDIYKEIGCKYVAIPWLSEEYRPGNPKFSELIEKSKILVEKAETLGLKLCYHNHDFEFTKVGEEYAIDILFSEVKGLMPEFDVCWVSVAGQDPAEYIRKYKGRQEILHLKDYVGSRSKNMYELIGTAQHGKQVEGDFEFRPVGSGLQNFPEILKAAEEVDMKWVVVELDKPTIGLTPMECAKASIDYLKSL